MTKEEILEWQVCQLKKLDFETLFAIGKSKEPLTYTLALEDGERQVEVNIRIKNSKKIEMEVAVDSNWEARFITMEDLVRVTITKEA